MAREPWWTRKTVELEAAPRIRASSLDFVVSETVFDLAKMLQSSKTLSVVVVVDAKGRPLSLVDRFTPFPLGGLDTPLDQMLKTLPPLIIASADYPFEKDATKGVTALLARTRGGGVLIEDVARETAMVLPAGALFKAMRTRMHAFSMIGGGPPGEIHTDDWPAYICNRCAPPIIRLMPAGSDPPNCDKGHVMVPCS